VLAAEGAAVIDADSDVAPRVDRSGARARSAALVVGRRGGALRLIDAADATASRSASSSSTAGARIRCGCRCPATSRSPTRWSPPACVGDRNDPAAVFAALERLEGAPGRLERVGDKDGAPVFVDYAHKPDALEKALAALRPFVAGRLVVVFGCGGDRDAGKRPMMGAIATAPPTASSSPTTIRAARIRGDPRRHSRRRAGRARDRRSRRGDPRRDRSAAIPAMRC
jgi:UDP-N-acetylmuramoyl-L-alanyl-D-glutamate--2,6-diaminopimelate ligase